MKIDIRLTEKEKEQAILEYAVKQQGLSKEILSGEVTVYETGLGVVVEIKRAE